VQKVLVYCQIDLPYLRGRTRHLEQLFRHIRNSVHIKFYLFQSLIFWDFLCKKLGGVAQAKVLELKFQPFLQWLDSPIHPRQYNRASHSSLSISNPVEQIFYLFQVSSCISPLILHRWFEDYWFDPKPNSLIQPRLGSYSIWSAAVVTHNIMEWFKAWAPHSLEAAEEVLERHLHDEVWMHLKMPSKVLDAVAGWRALE